MRANWIVPQAAAIVMILAMAGCTNPQTLPTDAQATCTVTAPVFASWFQSGSVTLDGVVNPADSRTVLSPNCGFYQWSKQMFLWLTSPAPATYGGGGGRIFDSPAFFDVSPPAADGTRTFLAHTGGPRIFNLRAAKVGPEGLQIIFDRAGRMLQVQLPEKGTPPRVRDVSGQLVEIAHARRETDGKLVLLDKDGKVIQTHAAEAAKPVAGERGIQKLTALKFVVDRLAIFLDPSLSVIDVEQGMADNGVLQAQNGSLVYYATMVNDVYTYFATGVKDHVFNPTPTQFPTSQTDLNNIINFASMHGKTFPDPNALAIEVKSAWVEAAGLSNLSSYITMTATIPTYDTSNPDQWTPNGQKTVQLALVGIHVVGSTAGHPEMVWATFEHFANAPRATYSYVNTGGTTVTVNQNTAANWLFCANNSSGPFNQLHMQYSSPNIVSMSPFHISPSDTIRWKAWGGASDTSNPGANTEVISINNSISGMIASGDVRNNYVMTGVTWTIGGAPPNSFNQVGTNRLANTTMETYAQGVDTTAANGGTNCFSCHTNNTTGVSHVFGALKPLF